MGTKSEEMALAAHGRGCLGKAASDEPIFILRAQDRFAPAVVEAWADFVGAAAGADDLKVEEARTLAKRMRQWQATNRHRVKVPD